MGHWAPAVGYIGGRTTGGITWAQVSGILEEGRLEGSLGLSHRVCTRSAVEYIRGGMTRGITWVQVLGI